ncbi:nascent polypeptide-associated complex subunit beta-like protein, partial [Tanacetum coccineum]
MTGLYTFTPLKNDGSCCYMAERKVGSDVVEDLTRESLIALSYYLLDSDLPPSEFPKNVKSVTEAVNTDEKDIVRCNLISISYAESPDTKDSPVSPVIKKKVVHETTTTDYKTLQSTLKRIGVNGIPAIEEVNIFKDETVIQFLNELFAKRMSGQKDCLTAQDPHVWRSADLKPGMHGLLADVSPKDELTNRLIQHVANIGEQHSSFFGIQNVPVQQIPSQGMTTSSDISRHGLQMK